MQLIILRHGKAEDHHPNGDFSRALTEKGREQARNAARFLEAAGELPEIVLASPLVRAQQTAEEFCKSANLPKPITQIWLSCGCSPRTALSELSLYRDSKRVMIVGHEPDLSSLIESLTAAEDCSIPMKKGQLACLEIHPPSLHGTLLYLVPPKLTGA
ncbi:MAG: phosphohistidine phosphatase SixA [Verrucomicrobiota bacterium]